MTDTLALFPRPGPVPSQHEPPGLHYADAVVSPEVQEDLIDRARTLDFAPFDFRGFKGNRRTVSFVPRYDFAHTRAAQADPLPDWLTPLRAAAAGFADIPEAELVQALVTEYKSGTGIGWHRDRPEYGKIIGLSFVSDCLLRFRRPEAGGLATRVPASTSGLRLSTRRLPP